MGYELVKTHTGGWAQEQEDRTHLLTKPMSFRGSVDYGNLPRIEIPKSNWLPVENQGNQGACQGHDLTDCMETAYYHATGEHVQLSCACGYYETQRIDGIRGDRGSTIMGGVRLAEGAGVVSLADWPYPGRYNPARPPGFESMDRWRTTDHVNLRSYEECIEFLAEGKGAISIGISWGGEIDQQVSRNGKIESFSGRSGGGHAIALPSFDLDLRDGDKPYIDLKNSWSKSWGLNGWAKVSPRAIGQMLAHRWTVFVGIFGAKHPKPEGEMPW